MASTKDIARSVPERPSWFISPSDITGRSIQPIGRGGLGEVFTGTYFGSKVAIKQLLGTCNIDQLNEYRHRIDLWKQLSHPNILSLLGACDQDDDGNPIPPFMVSPFMPNGTLLDHVANNNVPLEEKLRLLHQVAAGIAYLHDHNVVHGGLKAANVLLDSGANAVVSDFGLSRIKHTSTLTDRSRNSSYGAPETLDDDELGDTTMKTDVYAFAITTYEVLNDAKPVWITDDGEALQDQAIEQTVDHGQRPQQIDGIPNDIWTLIERCWAQTPADRPTFEQIAAALDQCRAGLDPTSAALLTSAQSDKTKLVLMDRVHPFTLDGGSTSRINAPLIVSDEIVGINTSLSILDPIRPSAIQLGPDLFSIVCFNESFQLALCLADIKTLLLVCKRARPLLNSRVNRLRHWCKQNGLHSPEKPLPDLISTNDLLALLHHYSGQDAEDRSWLSTLADRGSAVASYILARILQMDLQSRQSASWKERSIKYKRILGHFEKAADTGHWMAQLHLADSYRNGLIVRPDISKALQLYRDLAERGLAQAQVGLGRCFENGEGVDQDYETAIKWYTKAANQGNTDGKLRVEFLRGWFSLVGHGAEQSDADALKCWQEVSTQSSDPVIKPIATHMVGWMHYLGRGTPQDKQKGVKIIRDNRSDEFNFGEDECLACGVPSQPTFRQPSAALRFFELCQFGSAQDWLCKHLKALCLIQGFGTTQNKDMAVEIFEQLANDGHSDSQFWLAECYYNGWGVLDDNSKAFEWYSRSANLNNSYGQLGVGLCYYNECGVVGDDARAVEWYRKSAEQGNRRGQYWLGFCHSKGYGVAEDLESALFWYQKAADQGNEGAIDSLWFLKECP